MLYYSRNHFEHDHFTLGLWSKCQSSRFHMGKRWAILLQIRSVLQVWDLSIFFLRVHEGFGPSWQLGWRHAEMTPDGSHWESIQCPGYGSTIALSWYSTNGTAGAAGFFPARWDQVNQCSVSFVSSASFLIPEVLALTKWPMIQWCYVIILKFLVQAYVRCFPLLAMAVSLMIALWSQSIYKTQG